MFCPECGIGLNNREIAVKFCQNCHANWNDELDKKKNKSYGFKSKGGNVASVTFTGNKKPDKKTLEALSTMVDLAFTHLKKEPQTYPCPNCQGCGCTTCGGFGTLTY